MAKISELPPVAAPSGTETVVVLDGGETKRVQIEPLVRAAAGPAIAEVEQTGERVEDLFSAASLMLGRLPGVAIGAYLPATDEVPYSISDDFTEMQLGGTRISHQFRPTYVPSLLSGVAHVALVGEDGRGMFLRGDAPPLDPYAADVARYAGTVRKPFDVQPVFTTNHSSLAGFPLGYEQGICVAVRIPSASSDEKGKVWAYGEARTTLNDGDPKGIVRRLSRFFARDGSWEAQTLVASDFGVTGPDGVTRDNSFGNPSTVCDPTADPISGGKSVNLAYWRRQDIAAAGGLVAVTTDPERTSRIYGWMDDGTNLYDLTGKPLGTGPITRAQMTEATDAKPQSWASGSPGPGPGLAHSSGDLYWTIHGTPQGGGVGGRQICLVKLDRATRKIVRVSLSPLSTAEPNETGIAEFADGSGRILLSSRVETGAANDNRIRMLNAYDPATDSWDVPRMLVSLPDPQKAGCMLLLKGVHPGEPDVLVHANVAMHQTSLQQTLRHLTLRASWDNGYTWPVARRVYDSTNGYLHRRTDSFGNPLRNADGLLTSILWYAMTGYSAMVQVAPGVGGLLFENSGVLPLPNGPDQLGWCGFLTFTRADIMEQPLD